MNHGLVNLADAFDPARSPESDPVTGIQRSAATSAGMRRLLSLDEMLRGVIPLCKDAILVGQASDGLPVFLSLLDVAGPILIVGDAKTGKTNFLKAIACSAISTHLPGKLRCCVFTGRAAEWRGLKEHPACVGVFPLSEGYTAKFISSLIQWVDNNSSTPPVLVLIDGIQCIDRWRAEFTSDLMQSVLEAPSRRILPVATLDVSQCSDLVMWPKLSHTYVFGYTEIDRNLLDTIDVPPIHLDGLARGRQFYMKELNSWVPFWVPAVELY
jgi:hypothetical protein